VKRVYKGTERQKVWGKGGKEDKGRKQLIIFPVPKEDIYTLEK
jgi:hypothetical protein